MDICNTVGRFSLNIAQGIYFELHCCALSNSSSVVAEKQALIRIHLTVRIQCIDWTHWLNIIIFFLIKPNVLWINFLFKTLFLSLWMWHLVKLFPHLHRAANENNNELYQVKVNSVGANWPNLKISVLIRYICITLSALHKVGLYAHMLDDGCQGRTLLPVLIDWVL